ncbi:MAG: hypothetical protein M0Z95_04780 [Actinomycetota bacterium]|jgi:hypothetical protein|nr:hypothetical protein [Actinomycetota bacterium]
MSPKEAKSRYRQIMAEIAKVGLCLPGSLVERTSRCGSAGCHCHTDPTKRHGPYPSWTRSVGGKTVTRTLGPDQVERYKPFFDNSRRLKELVQELEALSVQVVSEAEGWGTPREGSHNVGDTPDNVSSTTVQGH